MITSRNTIVQEIEKKKPNANCTNLDCKYFVDSYEKKIYDLQQILEISRSLCSTLEFGKLIQSILDNCMAQFLVQSLGIFLLESFDSDSFSLGSNYMGFDIRKGSDYKISIGGSIASILVKENSVFTMHELTEELLLSEKHRRAEDISKTKKELEILQSLNPTLIIPLILRGHLQGILVFGERIVIGDDTGDAGEYYSDYEKDLILVISSLAAIAISNATLVERSATDMMTKLKLKYYFFNILSEKIDQARQTGEKIGILMFDIDFFKKFNDTYGHACGDYVLQTVASLIREGLRDEDMASRYGGEEFTVMLNSADAKEAMSVGERIRKKIEDFDFCYENQHVKVTISVGVAVYSGDSSTRITPNIIVDQADKALYVSKRNGRNRVTFADESIISDVKLPN